MKYEELKKEVFNKVVEDNNRVLNSIENILSSSKYRNDNNYEKLVKQLSYDYLVKKRREYKSEDLLDGTYQCENPANFPEKNSPLDKLYHINFYTAWTEDWMKLKCNDIRFNYLKNLDAKVIILGKDSTGRVSYKNDADKLKPYPNDLDLYINKVKDVVNPFKNDNQRFIAYESRIGFTPKGKHFRTNNNLRQACHEYLKIDVSSSFSGEIIPIKNSNIFFINSFVFLSASEMTPSDVPDVLFEQSVEKFIVPLLDIIKPKAVIQGGTEAIIFSRNGINKIIESSTDLRTFNKDYKNIYEFHKKISYPLQRLLNCTHEKMSKNIEAKEFLYHIQWNKDKTTYFYPVNHPSRPKYFYSCDSKEDGYYVWKYINRYMENSK